MQKFSSAGCNWDKIENFDCKYVLNNCLANLIILYSEQTIVSAVEDAINQFAIAAYTRGNYVRKGKKEIFWDMTSDLHSIYIGNRME